ncbi:MAG: PAS domain S-box protein [Chloroflexi bacterium]|nr:PAS domain S-box protein [Chloroflexota bacterium]
MITVNCIIYAMDGDNFARQVKQMATNEYRAEDGIVVEPVERPQQIAKSETASIWHKHKAKELPKVERYFQSLVENSPDAIMVLNGEGYVVYESPSLKRLLGYREQELTDKNTLALIHPDDRQILNNVLHSVTGNPTAITSMELRFRHKKNSWCVLEGLCKNLSLDGRVKGIVVSYRDITKRWQADVASREREERQRLVAENLTDIIWVTDAKGRYTYISPSVTRLRGYTVEEAMAQTLEECLTSSSLEFALQLMQEGQAIENTKQGRPYRSRTLDFELTCKDGSTVWTENNVTTLRDASGTPIAYLGISRDITERRRDEDLLRSYPRRLVQAQEEERRAIARELHDQIGQSLTAVKLLLARSMRSPVGDIASSLGEAQELVNDLTDRVRNLSLDLRPAMLDDQGLLPTLLWHFERYTARTHIRVNFKHAGLRRRLTPEVSTGTYRIVQEALTNVARHASVDEVAVHVVANEKTLTALIEDRGIGFDPAALNMGRCSGINGMRERAVLLGGRLTIKSVPGTGTRLTAELPLLPGQKYRGKEKRPR